ncbi:hypothetical protein niasHS_000080 [Heterodera schachtii]|uniref:Uncharacterized protein n=1 Tax=Heterodera schachtii TaxID=97005 RepID=A0ABD2KLW9_HETSC
MAILLKFVLFLSIMAIFCDCMDPGKNGKSEKKDVVKQKVDETKIERKEEEGKGASEENKGKGTVMADPKKEGTATVKIPHRYGAVTGMSGQNASPKASQIGSPKNSPKGTQIGSPKSISSPKSTQIGSPKGIQIGSPRKEKTKLSSAVGSSDFNVIGESKEAKKPSQFKPSPSRSQNKREQQRRNVTIGEAGRVQSSKRVSSKDTFSPSRKEKEEQMRRLTEGEENESLFDEEFDDSN